MMTANIGLNVGADPNFASRPDLRAAVISERAQVALGLLQGMGNNIGRDDWKLVNASHEFGEEPTLVVQFTRYTGEALMTLCNALRQECIAIMDDYGHGEIIGPNESRWGPFNPAYFKGLAE
jgi:hypothetical protein